MVNIFDKLVPPEYHGKQTILASSTTLNSYDDAISIFNNAIEILVQPDKWKSISGKLSPEFTLFDSNGNRLYRKAQIGDYIQINLPAPGNSKGDGYDWVMLDKIEDQRNLDNNLEAFGIRIRPSENPQKNDLSTVSHFFEKGATGTYILVREENTVKAFYYGNNEIPNSSTDTITDNIRNTIVASVGMIGISELQWKTFIENILKV